MSLEVARLVSGVPFLQTWADCHGERGGFSEASEPMPSISFLHPRAYTTERVFLSLAHLDKY